MNPLHTYRLLATIAISCCLMMTPTKAFYSNVPQQGISKQCWKHRLIVGWNSQQLIEDQGLSFSTVGDQASIDFGRTLKLNMSSNSVAKSYMASRVSEIAPGLPIAKRIKCWQATSTRDVVVEFRVRFREEGTPPGLTESLMLWNAPLPAKNFPESPIPATSIGVLRSSLNGTPEYQAVIAQDVPFSRTTQPFLRQTPAMPLWLNASTWHRVRITLSQKIAQVEVAQGLHPFTIVAQSALLHPAEPLGLVFSIDNEIVPGITSPVTVSDSIEIGYLRIGMVPIKTR